MEKSQVTTLRLGDTINYPLKGELVGVHYTLRNQEEQVVESTFKWGKPFEWRVGQSSMLTEIDQAIRQVSLGGKIRVKVDVAEVNKESSWLSYELELLYIK